MEARSRTERFICCHTTYPDGVTALTTQTVRAGAGNAISRVVVWLGVGTRRAAVHPVLSKVYMRPIAHRVLVTGGFSAYGLFLLSLGIILSGAGDGTYLALFVFSAPLKYVSQIAGVVGAFVLWLLAGLMLVFSRTRRVRTGLPLILIVHYLGALTILLTAQARELDRFAELFRIHPGLFAASFLIYAVGQVFIWFYLCQLKSLSI